MRPMVRPHHTARPPLLAAASELLPPPLPRLLDARTRRSRVQARGDIGPCPLVALHGMPQRETSAGPLSEVGLCDPPEPTWCLKADPKMRRRHAPCSCRCRAVLRAARGARVALRQRSTALQLHDGSKGCTLWLSARRGRRRPARSAGPRRCRSSWLLWSRGWNSACVARCAQVFFFRRVRFFSGSDKGPGSRSGLGLRRLPAGLRKHAQRCGKGWPAVGCSRRALYAVL